ncbi:hypothetical protein [Phormidesmis sp. 146-33]
MAQTQVAQSLETLPSTSAQRRSGFYRAVSGNARFFKQTTLRSINVEIDFRLRYGINASLGYKFGGAG